MLVGYHSLFLALQSLLASVTLLCMKTQAAFQFEVTLNTFTNPGNRLDDGECCDFAPLSCGICDPIFARFCLREFNQTDDNADNCDLGHYDEDNIDVGATIRINHNIPWPGSFQLRFVAEEDDTFSADDFIGDVTANVVLNVSDTFVGPVMIISENTRFTVELSFRVTCQQDFYGSDCGTFCLARNDALGHYSCNTLTGDIECLPGYQNVSSYCTVSICHVQCHVIGGFCLIPGECMCNMGWNGSQCDQCMPGEGCSPVGGYCTEPGECLCREGFFGELCTEPICLIQCHVIGGYCLIPGECRCNMGWNGTLCDQCMPAEECSPVGGYCTKPGECLCREGFDGELCNITGGGGEAMEGRGAPPTPLIAGVAAAGVVVLLGLAGLLLLLLLLCWCGRRTRRWKRVNTLKMETMGGVSDSFPPNIPYTHLIVSDSGVNHPEKETTEKTPIPQFPAEVPAVASSLTDNPLYGFNGAPVPPGLENLYEEVDNGIDIRDSDNGHSSVPVITTSSLSPNSYRLNNPIYALPDMGTGQQENGSWMPDVAADPAILGRGSGPPEVVAPPDQEGSGTAAECSPDSAALYTSLHYEEQPQPRPNTYNTLDFGGGATGGGRGHNNIM